MESKVLTAGLIMLICALSLALLGEIMALESAKATLETTRQSLAWYQAFADKQSWQLHAQGRLLANWAAAEQGPVNQETTNEEISEPKTTTVTAYTHTGQKTASGKWPIVGRSCAGPRNLPFGTVVWIDGVGLRIVEDRTHKRYDGRFDVFMETEAACLQFGKQQLTVEVIK